MMRERKGIGRTESGDVKNTDVLCPRIDESEMRPASEEEVIGMK